VQAHSLREPPVLAGWFWIRVPLGAEFVRFVFAVKNPFASLPQLAQGFCFCLALNEASILMFEDFSKFCSSGIGLFVWFGKIERNLTRIRVSEAEV
jgi:hypothetical protein